MSSIIPIAPLTEIKRPRQIPGEPARRWFTSEAMDLIVWLNQDKAIQGFQLCYGKPVQERALTWNSDQGFDHRVVDDGSVSGLGHKGTPVLMSDNTVDVEALLQLFINASHGLPGDIVSMVSSTLRQHPDSIHAV